MAATGNDSSKLSMKADINDNCWIYQSWIYFWHKQLASAFSATWYIHQKIILEDKITNLKHHEDENTFLNIQCCGWDMGNIKKSHLNSIHNPMFVQENAS